MKLNVLKKIWALPITVVGLAGGFYGVVYCLMKKRRYRLAFENNALTFTLETGGHTWSVTSGNVIIHKSDNIDLWNSGATVHSCSGRFMINLGKHEEMHTYQMERLGIFSFIGWIKDELRRVPASERWYEREADEYARIR